MIVPLLDVTSEFMPDWSLNNRDTDVLAVLSDEEFNFFTFEGLKRRLGMHPETLSRILSRLESEGIIRKSNEGYVLQKEAAKQINTLSTKEAPKAILLQTYLPSYLSTKVIISNLRGRWFGLLRWLGLSETGDALVLKWITEDGEIQIDAKISLNTLTIEAKFLHGYNHDLALKAAYQLVNHISKLSVQSPKPLARQASFYENSDYYAMLT
jgi:hypothetical protein